MGKNFITNIEIEKYKCFNNFKADNFKRINLIGGKNNVGKTAFIESCYLVVSATRLSEFLFALTMVEKNRDKLNIAIVNEINILDILKENKSILINSLNNIKYLVKDESFNNSLEITLNDDSYEIDFSSKILFNNVKHTLFIDNFGFTNNELKDVYKAVQFKDKDIELNEFLKNFGFINPKFKIIDDKPYLKRDDNDEYNQISKYGDGIKHYISILCSLYSCENGYLFIDEVENGIHYILFEKLWEIIFKVAEEQNVQLFVTTHSKECIESYNRVSKKLTNIESKYFELAQHQKKHNIFMRDLDEEQLEYELTHNGRYRGE